MANRNNIFTRLYNDLVKWSIRRGAVFTFILSAALSIALGYLFYYYILAGWYDSTDAYRQVVLAKEVENSKTEAMLAALKVFHGDDWSDDLKGEWDAAIENAVANILSGYTSN